MPALMMSVMRVVVSTFTRCWERVADWCQLQAHMAELKQLQLEVGVRKVGSLKYCYYSRASFGRGQTARFLDAPADGAVYKSISPIIPQHLLGDHQL